MRASVKLWLLCQWASGEAAPCIAPPAFIFLSETHGTGFFNIVLQWTCLPSNTIGRFLVNYGTVGPAGPFPVQTNTLTGISCPSSGPFVPNQTHILIGGLSVLTTYYFQAIAESGADCEGPPVFFQLETADWPS